MAIIRSPLSSDGFTMVPNHWLRDPGLSWKAKGLLAYLASHRVGYVLSVEQIIEQGGDGRDAVRAGLRELENAGYLVRVQTRGQRGRLGHTDYQINEFPDRPMSADDRAPNAAGVDVSAGRTVDGFSGDGESGDGLSVAGKPPPKKIKEKKTTRKKIKDQEDKGSGRRDQNPPPPSPRRRRGRAREPQEEEARIDSETQERAVALVADLPRLRATDRPRVASLVAVKLAAGWPPRLLDRELRDGIDSASSGIAVYLHRLRQVIPDAPPAEVLAAEAARLAPPAVEPVVVPPPWCGTCSNPSDRREAVEDEAGRHAGWIPCSRCHPDSLRAVEPAPQRPLTAVP